MEQGNTAHNSPVILKITVAVELNKFVKNSVDIIKSRRAVGFSGKNNSIPSCPFCLNTAFCTSFCPCVGNAIRQSAAVILWFLCIYKICR